MILLTNCSATQSVPSHENLRGDNLPRGLTNEEASKEWIKRVKAYKGKQIAPAVLYRGLAFTSVSKMQKYVSSTSIVSIGQGLVNYKEPIVPYDLSIDPTHKHSLADVVTEESFSPSRWWSLTNQGLGRSEYPIEQLLEDNPKELVIIACTGRFLSLLTEDLMSACQEPEAGSRIRIIVRSIANLPTQLKPYCILYDQRLSKASIGNRNDFIQRAALHFVKLLEANDLVVGSDIDEHQAAVSRALDKFGEAPTKGQNRNAGKDNVISLLKVHEASFKDMHPDNAYARARKEFGLSISAGQFRRAWREHFDMDIDVKPTKVKNANKAAAISAMAAIAETLDKPKSTVVTWKDEETALAGLQLFADALRDFRADAKFSSTEVATWAKQYYGEREEKVPPQLGSVGRVAHLLRDYHEKLGFVSLMGEGQTGGNIYMLGEAS